jgi:hypothetical protein
MWLPLALVETNVPQLCFLTQKAPSITTASPCFETHVPGDFKPLLDLFVVSSVNIVTESFSDEVEPFELVDPLADFIVRVNVVCDSF